MLLNYDAKQLEVRAFADITRDSLLLKEINEDVDFHADNQKRFKLPERRIAKIFLFRNIYCPSELADRTAYAYSVDNLFRHVGGVNYWRRVIEEFWTKYSEADEAQKKWIQAVKLTGKHESKTGREYIFEPRLRRGEWEWPLSDIANYPISGYSADLMEIARITSHNRLKRIYGEKNPKLLFINTVHDSLVFDVDFDMKECYNISTVVKKSFQDIPKNFEKIYNDKMFVPMDCDCKYGTNWLDMEELTINKEDLI